MPQDDDDFIDGCAEPFDDPAMNTRDGEQVDALVLFGDIPWVGETTDSEGHAVPEADPELVAERVRELQELSEAGF